MRYEPSDWRRGDVNHLKQLAVLSLSAGYQTMLSNRVTVCSFDVEVLQNLFRILAGLVHVSSNKTSGSRVKKNKNWYCAERWDLYDVERKDNFGQSGKDGWKKILLLLETQRLLESKTQCFYCVIVISPCLLNFMIPQFIRNRLHASVFLIEQISLCLSKTYNISAVKPIYLKEKCFS